MLPTIDDLMSPAQRAALDAPLGEATGLPGRFYSDPAVWDLERKTVFRSGWFAAGFASDIPSAGDVLPVSAAGWELVFVRGKDGEIRCFHNICRHRGTKLVPSRTNTQQLRCGWHCWTYGLDGELLSTPVIGGHRINQADGIDREALGLVPVRVEHWLDVLFVNPDGQAPPLATHLAPLRARLAPYGMDAFNLATPAAYPERMVGINWKLYHEGGLEGYHIPFVHPALEQPPGYTVDQAGETFISISANLGSYRRLGTADATDTPRFPLNAAAKLAHERGERLPYTIAFTPPTVIIAPWPEMLIITMLRPEAVNRTGVRRNLYFIGDAATNPACAAGRTRIADIWDGITAEDGDYSEGVQRMSPLRDEIGIGTRFSPHWEVAVRKFQQYVVRALAQR